MFASLPALTVLVTYSILSGLVVEVKSASVSTKPDCSDVQLSKCIAPGTAGTNNKFKLIDNEQDFDSLCSLDIDQRLRCIDNYTKNCFDNDRRSHFNKIYLESTMVIQEFCTDGGEYRKEFMKHAACLKLNRAAHEKCADTYSQSLAQIKTMAPTADANDNSPIRVLCCSLHEYISCSTETVSRTCGPETARFAGRFLERMVSSLIQTHCQALKITDGRCAEEKFNVEGGATGFHSSIFSLLLPLLLIIRTYWTRPSL